MLVEALLSHCFLYLCQKLRREERDGKADMSWVTVAVPSALCPHWNWVSAPTRPAWSLVFILRNEKTVLCFCFAAAVIAIVYFACPNYKP